MKGLGGLGRMVKAHIVATPSPTHTTVGFCMWLQHSYRFSPFSPHMAEPWKNIVTYTVDALEGHNPHHLTQNLKFIPSLRIVKIDQVKIRLIPCSPI
jgi:hypothetical protein